MPDHDRQTVGAYYAASLACLRFAEARHPTNRRFGAEADALWESFRGHLVTADRIDLLVRDADAQWRGALAARHAFALAAVAEDEPFGLEWPGLDTVDAEELWRRVAKAPAPAGSGLWNAVAKEWGLTIHPLAVGTLEPTSRLLVAGPSAVVALAVAFAERRDLSWSQQVTCVASPPAHRHIAALAAVFLNTTDPTQLIDPSTSTRPSRVDRVLVSTDASPQDLALTQTRQGDR